MGARNYFENFPKINPILVKEFPKISFNLKKKTDSTVNINVKNRPLGPLKVSIQLIPPKFTLYMFLWKKHTNTPFFVNCFL